LSPIVGHELSLPSLSYITTTQHITAAVTYLILFMNTSRQQIHTCKFHNIKLVETRKLHSNVSQLQHITATKHVAATATF